MKSTAYSQQPSRMLYSTAVDGMGMHRTDFDPLGLNIRHQHAFQDRAKNLLALPAGELPLDTSVIL